jgi:dienelactone hydrolase
LASHSQIDAGRIAIVGFSFGGEVAHLTALEPLRAALRLGPHRFAAHVAFYPAGVFGAIPTSGAYTGAPMLMMLGELDDNLPVAKIGDYLAYARAAGAPPPIEVVIYTGASCMDRTELGAAALLFRIRQHQEMPAHLVGPKQTGIPC